MGISKKQNALRLLNFLNITDLICINPRTSNSFGFTLLELLITITLIGILSAIALLTLTGVVDKAYYAQATAEMDAMGKDLLMHQVEHGDFPGDELEGDPPDGVDNWKESGPYDATYDYEHWIVPKLPDGRRNCHYVMITWRGKDNRRAIPVHRAIQAELGHGRLDDDLYEIVSVGPCSRDFRPGPVR